MLCWKYQIAKLIMDCTEDRVRASARYSIEFPTMEIIRNSLESFVCLKLHEYNFNQQSFKKSY